MKVSRDCFVYFKYSRYKSILYIHYYNYAMFDQRGSGGRKNLKKKTKTKRNDKLSKDSLVFSQYYETY